MSSTPPSGGHLFIESLEARIAPAGATGIANLPSAANLDNYVAYNVAPHNGQLGFVNATQYGIGDGHTFALQLSGPQGAIPGDKLIIFRAQGGLSDTNTFIQATAGNLVAFFQDKNLDGQVQTNELVGISMGKKAGVLVQGNVDGDIVTNLANNGTLTLGSVGKPGFKIGSLDISGNVNGSVLSGGDIGTGAGVVSIRGTVHNVLAGTAANGATYNLTGTPGVVSGTISGVAYKDGRVGASVNGLTVIALTPQGVIRAGDGGLGAVGGSVTDLTFLGDTDTFSVLAGAGGAGNATVKGGQGGGINNVLVNGVANSVVNHLITIQAGRGGDNAEFKAGVGGTVNGVFTSLDAPVANRQSADLLAQNLFVSGGAGGDGLRGGTGGDVVNSLIFGAIPGDGLPGAEIQVLGGHGGLNTTPGAGKGANGGSIDQVDVRNLDTLSDADNATILVQAGDAGLGKNGGNVDGVSVLGRNLVIGAGNGGDSYAKGGIGGSLDSIILRNLTNLFAGTVTLNAGQGGNGGTGNGGDGGVVNTVRLADSDLLSPGANTPAFVINGGTHGNGGNSAGGLGGQGGSVTDVQLNTSGFSGGLAGTIAAALVRSGIGGSGATGGGQGGDIAGFQFTGTGFSMNMTAGAGGSINPGGAGSGGGGGNLSNVGVANIPDVSNFPGIDPFGFPAVFLPIEGNNLLGLTGSVTAGAGGTGTADGGLGGVLSIVNLLVGDNATLRAGDGGSGGSGISGPGGAVNASGANSLAGSVTLTAGSAGLGGSVPGDGGLISGFVASASGFVDHVGNISITAGDGHAGGAGGAILGAGTTLNTLNGLPNFGNVTIHAGNGSDGNRVAGVGGDITTLDGYIGLNGDTHIIAGNGGGSDGSRRTGAGGSITNVQLKGDADGAFIGTTQTVFIDAGNAGISGVAKKGAAGGNVTSATLYNLDTNTIIHHVAAGNASGGTKLGALGGSIENLHVGTAGDATADIGIRTGVAAGYGNDRTTAGGLFAGVGGAGADGVVTNGSVVDVTANAISSIVAGKTAQPKLVELVDQVKLSGRLDNVPRANADGSFQNLNIANLVGSVVNPTAAGASTFKAGDGLVAAKNFSQDRNFRPEALLTLDVNGNRVLVDYRQPLPAPVTTPVPSFLL